MEYNHFTIDYLNAIKNDLKIEFNSDGDAVFLPDSVNSSDIANLKNNLQTIWKNSQSSVDLIRTKHDSIIQSGLFGLVNELDTALKVGFMFSDRVVLVDYLYERILLKNEPDKINITHLGVIASSLVNTIRLAERGRIVIIPNPFTWNNESKQIIKEVALKTTLTPDLMSLLNMLSITKSCNLHPFTIAESQSTYDTIIKTQIDRVDAIGKDGEDYAYTGILCALLTEKLLKETKLNIALRIPISKYYEIISSNKDFYLAYLAEITTGGSINGQNNIDRLRSNILKSIADKNKIGLPLITKGVTIIAGLGSGAIGLATAVSIVSAPVIITGAVLALSATLTGLVNKSDKQEQPIISVFNKLYED